MTGAELYRKIITYFKRDDKENEVYDAINDTINEITQRHSFNEKVKVTDNSALIEAPAGAYSFVLPEDFGALIGDIVLINGSNDYLPLWKLNKDEFDIYFPNIEKTNQMNGVPWCYCIFGMKTSGSGSAAYTGIQVFVGPRQQEGYKYKVNYITNTPAAVNKNTQKIPFGNFYKMIMFGALYHLYLGVEKADEAAGYKTLFEEQLQVAADYDKKNTAAVRFTRYNGL